MRPRAGFSLFLAWAIAGACSPGLPPTSEEVPFTCTTDADCPPAHLCATGSCVPPQGPGESECSRSDDCLPEPSPAIRTLYWDGEELVCTVDPGGCSGDPCGVRRVCEPQAEAATRPGAIGCSRDEQCLSGHCVTAGEDRICLRSCAGDVDCPFELDPSGQRFGTRCAFVEVGGASTLSCVPVEPGRPMCRNDCDCAAEDACDPTAAGARRCRYQAGRPLFPLCELPPAEALLPVMTRCSDAASCAGGRCYDPCSTNWAHGTKNFCHDAPHRCTGPCSVDADCPDRTMCLEGSRRERVGSWVLYGQNEGEEGRELLHCRLPLFGCFDEPDCRPDLTDPEAPIISWDVADPRCAVAFQGPATELKLLTLCVPRDDTRKLPGACCSTHEECDSALCVVAPTRTGVDCPVGVCSVPCAADSLPTGLPGELPARDRCPELTPLSPFFTESHCEAISYERQVELPDGSSELVSRPLNACR